MFRNIAVLAATAAIVLVSCGMAQPTAAEEWPQFLGPMRNGTSAETGLIQTFPAGGPDVLWRQPLGVGMSSVAVTKGFAVTLFQDETSQYVVAFDAVSGDPRWRTPVAPAFENGMGHGPRATPTVVDGLVHVLTGEGVLTQLTLAEGKQNWSVDVPASLGGKPAEYGVACSPVVTDGLVIVQAGSPQAAVAAWELKSGELRWKAGSGKAGYSSPLLATLAGRSQLVVFDASGASGLEPKTGEVLWSFPFPTDYDCNIATPVQLSDSTVLISAGENHGSVVLEISAGSSGLAAKPVWSSLGPTSQLRSEWQTPVVHDGYLYGLDNQGSAGPITNLVCVRLADWTTIWKQNRFGKSNLILADGRLWISTMKGELVLVAASPEGYQEVSRCTLIETTRQAPVIAHGRLYLRDDHELVCVQVRAL